MKVDYISFYFISIIQQFSYSIIVQNCKKSEPCCFLGKVIQICFTSYGLLRFPYIISRMSVGSYIKIVQHMHCNTHLRKKRNGKIQQFQSTWLYHLIGILILRISIWAHSFCTIIRDKLCPRTLKYLYTKASFPSRVFVGVVQQNEITDLDCLNHYCELMRIDGYRKHLPKDVEPKFTTEDYICPYKDNIRMKRVPAELARGPTWARAQGFDMLHDEEFCMQTDAHMDFLPSWDVNMLKMWAGANNEYAVLRYFFFPFFSIHL